MEDQITGIVSCYFIYNYGSMLQAYATQRLLDKYEIKNETINVAGFIKDIRRIQYTYILKSGITSGLLKDRLGKAKNLLVKKCINNSYTRNIKKRDKEFDLFANRWIRKSQMYSSVSELSKKCKNKYRTILIGSDQLWLPANIAADYYTLSWVPKGVNTVAYATSFGVSSLPKNILSKTENFLGQIKHISVREEAGREIVHSITGRYVPVVCDPTLLFSGDEWLELQDETPLIKGKYIFCYFIGSDRKHREFARKLKESTGLKIVALLHVDHYMKTDTNYADFTPYNVGPSGFLNLIRKAEYVCTDSFHSTVFSILYNKVFFTFNRYKQTSNQSTNNRVETLFNALGINDRLLNGNEDIYNCLHRNIDYDNVNKRLEKIRSDSIAYFEKAIFDLGSTDL